MKAYGILTLIIIAIIIIIIAIFVIKPYVVRHPTIECYTGELGGGKTIHSVKYGIVAIRMQRLIYYYFGNFKIKIQNAFIKLGNKIRKRHAQQKYKRYIKKGMTPQQAYKKRGELKQKPLKQLRQKPLLYSNIPMHFRSHLLGFKKEWSTKLEVKHLILRKRIREYSVVITDEMPSFLSQFDWDNPLVQTNLGEFITFFRHYIGGKWIINAQDANEIEVHIRRKINIAVWCSDFKVWPCRLLPLFYTCRMCDMIINDSIQTVSTTYLEENTKLHFGLFPRKVYDSRCYRPRYDLVDRYDDKIIKTAKWSNLQTTEVLRLRQYVSPLDTKTTEKQVRAMDKLAEKLERNEDYEIK